MYGDMMITIALCDDEVKFLDYYEQKLHIITKKHDILHEIIRFTSGESLLFYLEDHPNQFDIIYLDILTGDKNGIETAKAIRTFNKETKIIFLTSSASFVYDAFDTNPTNYILKNVHDNKFEDIFLSTVKSLKSNPNERQITFKSGKDCIMYPLDDITHFESFKRLVDIHLSSGETVSYYYKLSDLTSALSNENYVLIHRSYLANMQYIKRISTQ